MGASPAGCRCMRIRKSTALHRSSCRMRGDSSPAALKSRDHIGDVSICLQRAIRGSEPYVAFREEEYGMTGKKVWLITGAGRGLGVDIAKAVLAARHSVVATGRDAAKVAAAV